MIVRLQNNDVRQNPVTVRGMQIVVIMDEFEQPLAVFVSNNDGIWSRDISDPDFHSTVAELGLMKRKSDEATPDVAVQKLNPPPRGDEKKT